MTTYSTQVSVIRTPPKRQNSTLDRRYIAKYIRAQIIGFSAALCVSSAAFAQGPTANDYGVPGAPSAAEPLISIKFGKTGREGQASSAAHESTLSVSGFSSAENDYANRRANANFAQWQQDQRDARMDALRSALNNSLASNQILAANAAALQFAAVDTAQERGWYVAQTLTFSDRAEAAPNTNIQFAERDQRPSGKTVAP